MAGAGSLCRMGACGAAAAGSEAEAGAGDAVAGAGGRGGAAGVFGGVFGAGGGGCGGKLLAMLLTLMASPTDPLGCRGA